MNSLRVRLLAGMIGGMVALLIVFSVIIYSVFKHELVEQFDASLRSTAQTLAALVEYDPDNNRMDIEFDELVIPEFNRAKRPGYYQIWNEDGTVLARSGSLGQKDLLPWNNIAGNSRFIKLRLPNGKRGRAYVYVYNPRTEDTDEIHSESLILAVGRYTHKLEEELEFLAGLLVIAAGVTSIISFIVAALVVSRGLKPLQSLSNEIASIREDNLATRVGTEHMPSEMLPVKERLNDLLSRLETSFSRERRFTADVAHELRTPLAGVRTTLEVTLTRDRDANEYRGALRDCLKITKNMQAIVDYLLALARLDAQLITFQHEHIQLSELIDSCWRPFADNALERGIVFENLLSDDLTCTSDPEILTMVFSNVLANAVEYTNEKGQIRVSARPHDKALEITFTNTGCSLTDAQAAQVFDRFWRGDTSRTETGIHCGLGLSLVRMVIEALKGRTLVEIQNPNLFTLRIILPANS